MESVHHPSEYVANDMAARSDSPREIMSWVLNCEGNFHTASGPGGKPEETGAKSYI